MEANFNLALIDPPKWGWTAVGNVNNVMTPHENLRRRQRKRRRSSSGGEGGTEPAAAAAATAVEEIKPPPPLVNTTENNSSNDQPKTTASVEESSLQDTSSKNNLPIVENAADINGKHPEQQDNSSSNINIPITKESISTVDRSNSQETFPFVHGCNSVEPIDGDNPHVLRVKAVHDDKDGDILDMYTYHCGREGLEVIDEIEATDTGSANWMGPKTTKPEILVEFSLGCGEMWRETVTWDLEDEKTLTPFAFATNVAENFGLDFGATMDLAESIESQLSAAVQIGDAYPETPTTLCDYTIGKEHPHTKSRHSHWYGMTHGIVGAGGYPISRAKLLKNVASAGSTLNNNRTHPKNTTTKAAPIKTTTTISTIPRIAFRTEQVYRDQVIERVKRECKTTFKSTQIQTKLNETCHICQSKKPQCFAFACQVAGHQYCKDHLELLLPDVKKSKMTLDYCPICCLSCSCSKCQKNLDGAGFEFKKRTMSQKTKPSETVFGNMLSFCSVDRALPRANTQHKKKVPQAPRDHFPSEVCGGRNLEPGCDIDYRTVFTSEGAYLLPASSPLLATPSDIPTPPSSPTKGRTNEKVEDGNLDYCHICNKTGNLLCCDYCPRAFHDKCTNKRNGGGNGSRWECSVCLKEKAGLPEDKVTGNKIYKDGKSCSDAICKAFARVEPKEHDTGEYLQFLRALGMILEMIVHLIHYEFGDMFQEPVDSMVVPQYKVIVKNPMDLGTMTTRLVEGYYAELYQKVKNLDDVLVQLLNDIELIWQNCYTFNFEGSSIYRMAEVLARRSRNILKTSFDSVLKDSVKTRVAKYVEESYNDRRVTAKRLAAPSKSKHKINVSWSHGGTSRTIAVMNPETNMLMKLYTTIKAACLAAHYLITIGHSAEWLPLSDYTIKNTIKKSKDDPKITLFGYRWLYFDELRLNQIKFGERVQNPLDHDWLLKQDDCFIQMTNGKGTYLFLSVAEALSCSELSRDIPLAELKDRLCKAPLNEWIPLVGFKWRKITKDTKSSSSELVILSGDGDNTTKKKCVVLKEDKLIGRKLVGFQTIQAAYADWCTVCTVSPFIRMTRHEMSMGNFEKEYLYGNKHVDGIEYFMANRQRIEQLKKQKQQNAKQEEAISMVKAKLEKQQPPPLPQPPNEDIKVASTIKNHITTDNEGTSLICSGKASICDEAKKSISAAQRVEKYMPTTKKTTEIIAADAASTKATPPTQEIGRIAEKNVSNASPTAPLTEKGKTTVANATPKLDGNGTLSGKKRAAADEMEI